MTVGEALERLRADARVRRDAALFLAERADMIAVGPLVAALKESVVRVRRTSEEAVWSRLTAP